MAPIVETRGVADLSGKNERHVSLAKEWKAASDQGLIQVRQEPDSDRFEGWDVLVATEMSYPESFWSKTGGGIEMLNLTDLAPNMANTCKDESYCELMSKVFGVSYSWSEGVVSVQKTSSSDRFCLKLKNGQYTSWEEKDILGAMAILPDEQWEQVITGGLIVAKMSDYSVAVPSRENGNILVMGSIGNFAKRDLSPVLVTVRQSG